MKKLKILISSVLVAAAAMTSFAAVGCKKHKHTYEEKWTTTETHHWHNATCEHEEEQGSYGAHSYDANYKCTVCDYQHFHTYDANYKCACGYQHTHGFETTWTSNDRYHWYETTCGHSEIIKRISHTLNADYKCTVCGHQLVVSGLTIKKGVTEYSLTTLTINVDLSDIKVYNASAGGVEMDELTSDKYTLSYYKGKQEITAVDFATAGPGTYNIWAKSKENDKAEAFVIIYVLDKPTKIEMIEGETTQCRGPVTISNTWKFRVTYASGATKEVGKDDISISGLTTALAKENAKATVSYSDVNAKGVKTEVKTEVTYSVTAAAAN